MVTHYLTLKALQLEFDARLRGTVLREAFSQQRGELVLSFARGAGEPAASIVVSIDAKLNVVVLRDPVARARRNSVDLFGRVVGETLEEVAMDPADRMMLWRFSGGLRLCLQLYNSAASNILLVDASRAIIDAFKDAKELAGTALAEPRHASPSSAEGLAAALRADGSAALEKAVRACVPQLGGLFTKELIARTGLDARAPVSAVSDADLARAVAEALSMFDALAHPSPVLYLKAETMAAFSPFPLVSQEHDEAVTYAGVNEGVRDVLRRYYRVQGRADVRKELLAKIVAERDRAARRRDAVAKEIGEAERAMDHERNGKLLLAHLDEVRKGMREIVLEDFDATEDVRIALDPTLPAAANAERYFTKAKKARAARAEAQERLPGLERALEGLSRLAAALEPCTTVEEVEAFMESNGDELRALKLIEPAKGKELPPFRLFTVEGGYEVWVGKSSANNDLLTMKYAKQNDLWFHVRGASGSHTILRVAGSEAPPKGAIRQAASIAAYYSKMRNAGNVPVAYCERKYVRKPKGLAQGAVILERETTILVKPGLPKDAKEQ
jgi:predicted ribosome quality control (RQC) complex YloA/Tae2 family protein